MMCPTAVASRDSNFCSPGNASQPNPKSALVPLLSSELVDSENVP